MHRRWLSVPLLTTCVSAFYPYQPDSDGAKDKKRFIPINVDSPTADDAGVFTMDMKKGPIHKRANSFSVVYSSTPDTPNAMAIDEDGSDLSYFSVMKFGSKGQDMLMLLDTGSANTWLMGSNCASNACSIHNTFGPADSSTLNTTTQTWSLSYGSGQVQGVVAGDTVAFADYNIEMGFGLASSASDDFNNYPMDGILGLGRPSSDDLGTPTVMDVLKAQNKIQQNILGVHLQRNANGAKDGQITFGGVDKSKFNGQISYSPTTNTGSWEIAVGDANVNGKACNFQGKSAIMDTGTSYILMPPSDAQTLHGLIPGSSQSGSSFTVPCTSTAVLQFSFSGVSYPVSPEDYVGKPNGNACNSNIIGHQAFGPNEWIMGDTFLKNVYTVFDFDKNRIGFGTKSGAISASTSLASSTSSSPSSTSTTIVHPSTTLSHSSQSSSSQSGSTTKTSTTASARSSSTTMVVSATTSQTSSTASSRPAAAATSAGDSSPFNGSSSTSAGSRSVLNIPCAMILAFIVGFIV